jgi:hypothetical protein
MAAARAALPAAYNRASYAGLSATAAASAPSPEDGIIADCVLRECAAQLAPARRAQLRQVFGHPQTASPQAARNAEISSSPQIPPPSSAPDKHGRRTGDVGGAEGDGRRPNDGTDDAEPRNISQDGEVDENGDTRRSVFEAARELLGAMPGELWARVSGRSASAARGRGFSTRVPSSALPRLGAH